MLMSDINDNYLGVLLEKMSDELKAIHEEVGGMREELMRVPKREEFEALKNDVGTVKVAITDLSQEVREVKQDVKVIKAAVVDLGHQTADHEHRITRLEATS